jgi:beta-lactamase class A
MKIAKRFPNGPSTIRCYLALAALLVAGCAPSAAPPGKATRSGGERIESAAPRAKRVVMRNPESVRKDTLAHPVVSRRPASVVSRSHSNANALHVGGEPLAASPPPPPPPAEFATVGAIPERLAALVAEARRKRAVRAVGIAVVDLAHGQGYGVAPHRVFRPASVIKLAVMVRAFQAAPQMPTRAFDRLRPDIRRMITVSDNPSTTRLVRRLGRAPINAAMRALGLPGIALQPTTSPRGVLVGSRADAAEVALLLARLARREVVSRPASEEMLRLLGAQHRRGRIPAGLTAQRGLWIGNKTGTLPGLVHDAGIVMDAPSGLAYTLAIFTEGAPSERAGERLCAAISAEVYRLLRSQVASGIATEDSQR